jgi:hypothetical protein
MRSRAGAGSWRGEASWPAHSPARSPHLDNSHTRTALLFYSPRSCMLHCAFEPPLPLQGIDLGLLWGLGTWQHFTLRPGGALVYTLNIVGGSICAPLLRPAVRAGTPLAGSSGHFPFKTVKLVPRRSILSSSYRYQMHSGCSTASLQYCYTYCYNLPIQCIRGPSPSRLRLRLAVFQKSLEVGKNIHSTMQNCSSSAMARTHQASEQ